MKFKEQGLAEHLGSLGFVIALAVFFGVSWGWSSLEPSLVEFGLEHVEGPAALEQQRLVAAGLAFLALVPLLAIQLTSSRRRSRTSSG